MEPIIWIKKYGFWVFPATGIAALLMFFNPDNTDPNRITQADLEQVILGGYERAVMAGVGYAYLSHMTTALIGTNQTATQINIYTNDDQNLYPPVFQTGEKTIQLASYGDTAYGVQVIRANEAFDSPYTINETLTYTPYWGFPWTNGSLRLSKPGTAISTNLALWKASNYYMPAVRFAVTAHMPWSKQLFRMGTNYMVKAVVIRTTTNTNAPKYTIFVKDYYPYSDSQPMLWWGEYDTYWKYSPETSYLYEPKTLTTSETFPYEMMPDNETITAWTNVIDYCTMTNAITGYKDDYGKLIAQLINILHGGQYPDYPAALWSLYAQSLTNPVAWPAETNYAESVGLSRGPDGYYGAWRGMGYEDPKVITQEMYMVTVPDAWTFDYDYEQYSVTQTAVSNYYDSSNNVLNYYYVYGFTYQYLTGPKTQTIYNVSTSMYSYMVAPTNYNKPFYLRDSYHYTGSGYTNVLINLYSISSSIPVKVWTNVPLDTPVTIIKTNPAVVYQDFYGGIYYSAVTRISKQLMIDLYKYLRGLKYVIKPPTLIGSTVRSGGVEWFCTGYSTNPQPGWVWSSNINVAETAYLASTGAPGGTYNAMVESYYYKFWGMNHRNYTPYIGVGLSRKQLNNIYDWSGASFNADMTNIPFKVYTCLKEWKLSTWIHFWTWESYTPFGPNDNIFDDNDDWPNFTSTGVWFVATESPYSTGGGGGSVGNWVVGTNSIVLTNADIGSLSATLPNAPPTWGGNFPKVLCQGYQSEIQGLVAPAFNYCTNESLFQ